MQEERTNLQINGLIKVHKILEKEISRIYYRGLDRSLEEDDTIATKLISNFRRLLSEGILRTTSEPIEAERGFIGSRIIQAEDRARFLCEQIQKPESYYYSKKGNIEINVPMRYIMETLILGEDYLDFLRRNELLRKEESEKPKVELEAQPIVNPPVLEKDGEDHCLPVEREGKAYLGERKLRDIPDMPSRAYPASRPRVNPLDGTDYG